MIQEQLTNETLIDGVRAAADVLESVASNRELLADVPAEDRERLVRLAGEVYMPDPIVRRNRLKMIKRARRDAGRQREEATLSDTGIRRLRRQPAYSTPNVFPPAEFEQREVEGNPDFREATEPQHCYVCKQHYTSIHHFYDQLCAPCAELNYFKRTETANLRGRVALLTGGRVKIGYQAGLKMVRAGAKLVVTTRFPRDSAARYAKEPDFNDWSNRLEIHGLDLRHTPSVEAFCSHLLKTADRLDFIINNASQTVRRPPEFYQHMMANERALPAVPGLVSAAELSQVRLLPEEIEGQEAFFPVGRLDQDLQAVDLRDRNSWRLTLAEVSSVELLEVHLVNAVAPFIINARLKPLMLRSPERDKHIVNVSAVEGQFYRRFKTTRHPHTNMAKAALNMMTRTSAADYHADGIHMNAVDTGWVTDEDPRAIAERKQVEHRFHPPLDIVDGAARVVDPIISGFNTGKPIWGQFLKDFKPSDW